MLSKEQKQWGFLLTLAIIGFFLYRSKQLLDTVLGRFYLVSIVVLATRHNTTAGLIIAGFISLMYMNTWYTEGFDNNTGTGTTPNTTTTSSSPSPKQMDKISAEHKMRAKSSNKSMYQQISTSAYTEPSSHNMVGGGNQLGWAPF